MEDDNVLLIAGNHPHTLMRHIKVLIKKKGRSVLWGGSFVELFENEFPDLVDENFILQAAYGLGIPRRFQEADRQPVESKKICIKQALFLLVQCMKEYEAVMFVESFMYLLRWKFEFSLERVWEAEEEDRAKFHQLDEKKAVKETEPESIEGTRNEAKKEKEQQKMETELSGNSVNKHAKAAKDKMGTEKKDGKDSGKLAKTASERRQKRREADTNRDKEKKTEKKPLEKPSEILEYAEETMVQLDPGRDVKFLSQMNAGMQREVKWAKKGNADAQQRLGGFYSEEGTKHLDYKEAIYWYRLSANQGNYKAQLELGRIFDSGKIQEENSKSKGIYWYRKLAEAGFPTAQCILGAKYLWGDGVEADKREAVHWLRKAAAQGYEEAEGYLLGCLGTVQK